MKTFFELREASGQIIARFDTAENAKKHATRLNLENFDLVKVEIMEEIRTDSIESVLKDLRTLPAKDRRKTLTAACNAVKPKKWS